MNSGLCILKCLLRDGVLARGILVCVLAHAFARARSEYSFFSF